MSLEAEVLSLDDEILVVNKPAGLLSLPDGYDPSKPHLRMLLEPEYGRLWMVHRLDKDTSGIIVLARNKESHRFLNGQFSERKVEKIYHAILVGAPPWREKRIDGALRANVGRRKRSVVDPLRGKPASTSVRVMERFGNYALVEARPKTGRPHQIRVHLYALGYPILADPLYGKGTWSAIMPRLALHALSLTFLHPALGKAVSFTAPIQQDFATGLDALRNVNSQLN